jgi:hypothetical protein
LVCTAAGERSSAGFRPALAALLVLAVLVEAAIAGPLENAAAAFQRGDYATTRRIMQSLAEQGDPAAQWRLGRMYYYGLGAQLDWAEALDWYRKAAEQGHAAAQYDLGNMYYRGLGVPSENYGEAMGIVRLLSRATSRRRTRSATCTTMALACSRTTSWRTCGPISPSPIISPETR